MMPIRSSKGLIHLSPRLPNGWTGKVLPGSEASSYVGKLGTLVLQEIVQEHFVLRYFHFRPLISLTVHVNLQQGWQSFLNLKGRLPCVIQGNDHIFAEGQFLFFYGGNGQDVSATLPAAADIQWWSTGYKPHCFKRWLHLFPKLKISETVKSIFLLPSPLPARTGIINAIRDQFYEEYAPLQQPYYLHLKVEEQLFGFLSQVHDSSGGQRATPWERECAYRAQQLILKDLRIHISNEDLAKMVELDRASLNRAFSLEYGLGMHHYLIRARFEKARALILEGQPLKKVANLIGYKRTSTFSFEFRKYYHYSPVDLQNGTIKP